MFPCALALARRGPKPTTPSPHTSHRILPSPVTRRPSPHARRPSTRRPPSRRAPSAARGTVASTPCALPDRIVLPPPRVLRLSWHGHALSTVPPWSTTATPPAVFRSTPLSDLPADRGVTYERRRLPLLPSIAWPWPRPQTPNSF